jgi:hypothetical protein
LILILAARSFNSVIKEVRLNYILATDENWKRIELACDELGWNKSAIVKQMLHGFFHRDSAFYARAGLLDAEARGMSEEDYFNCLRDRSEDELHPYAGDRPLFGQSPIDTVPTLPTDESLKRKYNTIGLSAYNYVLLKVARVVHHDSFVQIVSRMIVKHLNDNWDTVYQPQIDRDQHSKFL